VGVSDNGEINRSPWVDVEISRRTIKTGLCVAQHPSN